MRKGQSITEYTLALGLVGIVALGSVAVLGNGIQTGLNSAMVPGTSGPTSGGPQANPLSGSAQNLPGVNGGIGGVVPPPLPGQDQVCFGSGLCANIALVPEGTKIDVLGTNGGEWTHQFANTLQEIADQIKAEGLDLDLAKKISQLAAQGHTMGDTQDKFCKREMFDCYFNHEHEFEAFQKQYQDILVAFQRYQGGIKSDAMSIITSQSQQIIDIGNIFTPIIGLKQPQDKQIGINASIESSNLTILTHQSANTICDQGGSNCHRVTEETDSQG